MFKNTKTLPLTGYVDKLSVRAGERISFKVSSKSDHPFNVQLKRVICADPNPDGLGIIEDDIEAAINGSYPSLEQAIYPGSYALVRKKITFTKGSFALSVNFFPTLKCAEDQVIIAMEDSALFINTHGCLSARVGDNIIESKQPVKLNQWYVDVELSYDQHKQELCLKHPAITGLNHIIPQVKITKKNNSSITQTGYVCIAADLKKDRAIHHFNGKIEDPTIWDIVDGDQRSLLARWDFAKDISSTVISDVSANKLHGKLINFPTRAVKGSQWSGEEMCWRHAPEEYAAIHFHEDDIYDARWQTSFSFDTPIDFPSGIYAAELTCGEHKDAIPFFVCPKKDTKKARLCVLVSTYTYTIYGNHARSDVTADWYDRVKQWNAYPANPLDYPIYGFSTYNTHSDGSGICHASHLRPILNMRPGYITFAYGTGSGLRHFQADSHLIAWLHHKEYDYDIITDNELNNEGVSALDGYQVVTTGTHPEYHTEKSLNALRDYRNRGGKLMYLGGNGFYWRITTHPENSGLLEIRRTEGGIRAWASQVGEYYHAFDGRYGGLWRRCGRSPQELVGIGFSAQGNFQGSYYVRTENKALSASQWVFNGIKESVLGDFGFSGGGAAGYELDRADFYSGSPENIEILASSENHQGCIPVPEEVLTHLANLSGEDTQSLIRADIVYFKTIGGGEVFSVGSITFCGSLPYHNFKNNISKMLENVLNHFLSN